MSTGTSMAVEWRLRQLLDKRSEPMSLSELSRRTGISYTTIHAIAAGDTMRVDRSTLDALCRELAVTPGDLLAYVPAKKAQRT